MARPPSVLIVMPLVALGVLTLAGVRSEAHKPITSPYTFNEDVFPIVRDRCGRCHVAGGVAPMSLMTHQESVPWGESIRTEVIAGHMPPWNVETAASRFRNVSPLSARELNILLTWASGGTPIGNADKNPPTVAPTPQWTLGEPDLAVPIPTAFTLDERTQEATQEFTIELPLKEARWVRAVDLLPGNPAMVRSATIAAGPRGQSHPAGHRGAEDLLALWLPGDDPAPLDRGVAYRLAPGTPLVVRVHYRKTWQNERNAMSDRSTVGLYFADAPAADVEAIALAQPGRAAASDRISFTQTIDEDVKALAIYPDPSLAHVRVRVDATRPDGSREELIAFRPQPDWARRFWFAQPIALPRGTQIETTVLLNDPEMLPPGASPPPAPAPESAAPRLVLNVVRDVP
jgi:hypothetical protein